MSNYQKISSFIWNVADDVLRGLFKPHEYGQIILPFTVLRRLDSILEPSKDEVIKLYKKWKGKTDKPTPIILNKIKLKFYNHSKYDLKRLTQDHQNIKKNFQNYLGGFSDNIYDIIENFQIEKHISKLHKNDRLFLLIEKFASTDLSPSKISNYEMGQIFEELLRKFSEMSNETSGEHYTPRDVVRLLVELVFAEYKQKLKKIPVVSIFDCCCGTGGMLTIGKEWLQKNVNQKIKTLLFGQELNPETFAICKADMLITDEDPENIRIGNSLSKDQFKDQKFQYMITNPPYGVSWKSDENFVKNECQNPNGRFSIGTPRTSDGQLLFLQHLISKMDPSGSKIGIVFNGSPLFTGDAGGGESEIRKWIIENDWLECIVALPDQMFFNTGISTYLWVVTNKKSFKRKGKIQLVNASSHFKEMKKNLGNKRKIITQEQINEIIRLFLDFKENKQVKIFSNQYFGYTKITVENPLKENGKIIKDKKGQIKSDSNKRDIERISLTENTGDYFDREVLPHLPEAWFDSSKGVVGYEINFAKYFYKHNPSRSLDEIEQDLMKLKEKTQGLLKEILK